LRKGGIYEAVYRDGGSGRIRLLLRSAPHDVPPAPVARLGFKQALGRTVYAVTFEQSEKYHTHFYPLSEVIRVEETEIEVKDRRKREWEAGHEVGCSYREGEKRLSVLSLAAAPAPEVGGDVENLRTFEQFGGRVLVVAFTSDGLRRFHKFPVTDIMSVQAEGVKHNYP